MQVTAQWTLRPNDAKAPKDASEGGIAGVSEVAAQRYPFSHQLVASLEICHAIHKSHFVPCSASPKSYNQISLPIDIHQDEQNT